MMRLLLALTAALGTAASTSAQFPTQSGSGPFAQPQYYPPQNVMPNIYNPANQPLSPYLNLLRGGNVATNYYYGVRPGTAGGFGFGLGAPFTAMGGNRPPFFPQLVDAPDPLQSGAAGPGSVLPPAGHMAIFNNTMGFYPSPFGNRGGGTRPGLAGVGNSRPPSATGR